MTLQDLAATQLDQEFAAADAKLDALRARAEAARAEEQTDRISRLWPLRQRVVKRLAELKRGGSVNLRATLRAADTAMQELETRIDRAGERFSARDYAGRDVSGPSRTAG
jgi:hypothetical protein